MTLPRVVVTRPVVGICHMQVCAVNDASDEEILEACNRENPAGTEFGWTAVVRRMDGSGWPDEKTASVVCDRDSTRVHMLVSC